MDSKELLNKGKDIIDEVKNLDFEQAKEMTVEEAVRKEADLQAGITEADDVLDKYIKKHKEEIGNEKFVNKVEDLDTKALDDFIQKQKQDLAERKAALVGAMATAGGSVEETAKQVETSAVKESVVVAEQAAEATKELKETATEKGHQTAAKLGAGVVAGAAATKSATAKAGEKVIAGLAADKEAGVAGAKPAGADDKLLSPNTLKDQEAESRRGRGWILGALAALLLGILGLGYGLNHLNQSANQSTAATDANSSKTASSGKATSGKESAELKAFNDLYQTFFVDDKATKPKNSEFDKLPELEAALKKLEGTSDYDAAKAKFDSLTKAVTAIKAINDKFETDAIVDGKKVEATLKEGATFDDLSSDILNTGKASLDTLIQAVLAEGRTLANNGGGVLTAGVASDNAGATETSEAVDTGAEGTGVDVSDDAQGEAASAESTVVNDATTDAEGQVAEASAGSEVVDYGSEQSVASNEDTVVYEEQGQSFDQGQVTYDVASDTGLGTGDVTYGGGVATDFVLPEGHVQAWTNYGYASYNPTTLQRDKSRVPFNFDLIADSGNPAWTFTPGVMEEIIRISQERGYISGQDFILEPVNIVNGNGYYNMYKPDGTYLFTLNAKTGYFVGNGAGYSDDLDY